MFKNLTLRHRLLSGAAITAVLVLLISAIAFRGIIRINRADTALYEGNTEPLGTLVDLTEKFQRVRGTLKDVMLAKTPAARHEKIQHVLELARSQDSLTQAFRQRPISDSTAAAITAFERRNEGFRRVMDEALRVTDLGRIDEATRMILGPVRDSGMATQEALSKATDVTIAAAQASSDANSALAARTMLVMAIGACLCVLFSVLSGWLIARAVTRPVQALARAADQVAAGNLAVDLAIESQDEVGQLAGSFRRLIATQEALAREIAALIEAARSGRLSERADATRFEGTFRELCAGVNQMLDETLRPMQEGTRVMQRIARGDLSATVTGAYQGDHELIKTNLNATIAVLQRLVAETGRLIEAARSGQLSARADAESFEGAYRELCAGINQMLDATLRPVEEGTRVLQRLARGDLSVRVNGEYQGDHQLIKTHLNDTIEVLGRLVTETGRLIQAAREGRLDERAEAAGFAGT